jgi:hypothetical protein
VLYHVLEARRKQLRPSPPRPYHAELGLPIRLADGIVIPTVEETAEDMESETKSWAESKFSRQSPAGLADFASAGIEIEQDGEPTSTASRIKPKPASKSSTQLQKPQVWLDADMRAEAYRNSHPVSPSTSVSSSANPSALSTYYMWYHNPEISLQDIAAIRRDPPLQISTVSSYITDAIRIEKLPADPQRLREILEGLPKSTKDNWRYKGLWQMVNGQKGGRGFA